ncbi:MAG: hypothetical protein U0T81_15550 [Saprospiraceae bacterium]
MVPVRLSIFQEDIHWWPVQPMVVAIARSLNVAIDTAVPSITYLPIPLPVVDPS